MGVPSAGGVAASTPPPPPPPPPPPAGGSRMGGGGGGAPLGASQTSHAAASIAFTREHTLQAQPFSPCFTEEHTAHARVMGSFKRPHFVHAQEPAGGGGAGGGGGGGGGGASRERPHTPHAGSDKEFRSVQLVHTQLGGAPAGGGSRDTPHARHAASAAALRREQVSQGHSAEVSVVASAAPPK